MANFQPWRHYSSCQHFRFARHHFFHLGRRTVLFSPSPFAALNVPLPSIKTRGTCRFLRFGFLCRTRRRRHSGAAYVDHACSSRLRIMAATLASAFSHLAMGTIYCRGVGSMGTIGARFLVVVRRCRLAALCRSRTFHHNDTTSQHFLPC